MKRACGRAATVLVSAVALVLPMAAPASAAQVSEPLAEGLIGPLGLAIGPDGTAYVAEAFRGALSAVAPDGSRTDLHVGKDWLPGVDVAPTGEIVFTAAREKAGGKRFEARLYELNPGGQGRVLADLSRHEARSNPDADQQYGFLGLSDACAQAVPEEAGGGYSYSGIVDSNPYAVAAAGGGVYYVADAAANAVLRVSRRAGISVVAVLPPQPVEITAELVEEFNGMLAEETPEGEDPPVVPDCVVGATYVGEPVPTDVEIGPDGALYVSTLPGFPELPGTGSVYRVDPGSGGVQLLGTGFSGATDLAVAPDGTVYVAELFGGRVSRLTASGPVTVAELPLPAAVEWAAGQIYVTYGTFFPSGGSLAVITP